MRFPAIHDVIYLLAIDGFVLDQRFGHDVQLVQIFRQDIVGTLVIAVDDRTNLLINRMCRVI